MLELDALLANFLDREWPRLTAAEREAFEDLLSYADQTLFECVVGHMTPFDRVAASVVRRIREGAAD
jgi:succinate dehydrogenase flavin-adding protein (antitoxin of CptAB toxin-antitoxin module)